MREINLKRHVLNHAMVIEQGEEKHVVYRCSDSTDGTNDVVGNNSPDHRRDRRQLGVMAGPGIKEIPAGRSIRSRFIASLGLDE